MKLVTILGASLLSAMTAFAAINVPSDGSDGILAVSADRTVNLAAAQTGTWSDNNSAHEGNGIYDAVKRAVVFKYSSVTINATKTLTFTNHPSRAPVVWLVSGNVDIAGTVNLNGAAGNVNFGQQLAEPGPGGFRGAAVPGSGLGIGGGIQNAAGKYASYPYGNISIIPLIGGSGSSYLPFNANNQLSGGAGGGAILIAAAGRITVNGSILANGGSGAYGASGGGIRLVAEMIDGTGSMSALPDGRTRMEANQNAGTITANPQAATPFPTNPPTIWQADDAPSARIFAVQTTLAPLDPRASSDISNPDITLSENGNLSVTVRTTNFPIDGTPAPRVRVRYTPRSGGTGGFSANGTFIEGDMNSALWNCTVPFQVNGYSILQAIATVP